MSGHPIAALARLARRADTVSDGELLRRFAEARDESAFELLVWRYAKLVLGTCRRALGNPSDADDAFQATFLALARQAGRLDRTGSLGGWLHRVALRAAGRLRTVDDRRRRTESAVRPSAPNGPSEPDTRAVLDEEIARLPDKLRVAFVMCALGGFGVEGAAAELGCPPGTVMSRLSRARERLRARLAGRGLAPALAAGVVGVPAELVAGTVRCAVPFASGLAVEGAAIPAAVAAGVLRAMAGDALKRVGIAVALLAMVAGAALAAGTPTAVPLPPTVLTQPTVAPVPKPAPTHYKLALTDINVGWVERIAFSPDGKWLVTTGEKINGACSVDVWDAATGRHARTFAEPGPKPAFRDGVVAVFSPDGKTLAVAFRTCRPNGTVTLWSVGTWAQRAVLPDSEVTALHFSADNKLLVASTAYNNGPGESRVWDAASGKLIHEQPGAEKTDGRDALYYTPVLSPDSSTFLIPASNAPVRVFEAIGKLRFELPASTMRSSLVYSPDSKSIAARTTNEKGVQVFDATTGKVRSSIPTPAGDEQARVQFSPDGTALLLTSFRIVKGADGWGEAVSTVRLHDAVTGKLVRTFEPDVTRLESLLFSPDGTWVAGASKTPLRPYLWDADVWVWNSQSGTKTTLFGRSTITGRSGTSVRMDAVRFSPDGKVVAVSAYETRGNEHGSASRDEILREEIRWASVLCDPRTGLRVTLPGVRWVEFGPAGTVALITGPPDSLRGRLKHERDEVTVRELADLLREAR